MDLYVLGLDGEPLRVEDVQLWARWWETADRRIGFDVVGRYHVSTVFLGIDHGWHGGPPVLWETMVFDAEGESPWRDEWCHRYSSRDEAALGHAMTVTLVRAEVEATTKVED